MEKAVSCFFNKIDHAKRNPFLQHGCIVRLFPNIILFHKFFGFARQKEYIKTVRELQTVLSDVRTVEDAAKAYDRFFVDNGYLEKVQGWGWGSGIHYRATKKGQDNPVITNKLSNTMLIRSAE